MTSDMLEQEISSNTGIQIVDDIDDAPLNDNDSLNPSIQSFMAREAQAFRQLRESPEVQKIMTDVRELSELYQKPQEFMSKFSKMDANMQYHVAKTIFFPEDNEVSSLGYRAEEYVVEFHNDPINIDGSLNKPDFFVIDGSKLGPNLVEGRKVLTEPELPNGIGKNDLKSILLSNEFNPKKINTKLYLAFQAQMLDTSDKKFMDNATAESTNIVDLGLKWQKFTEKKSSLDHIKSTAKKIVEQARVSGLKLDKSFDEVVDILWNGYTVMPTREWITPTDEVH